MGCRAITVLCFYVGLPSSSAAPAGPPPLASGCLPSAFTAIGRPPPPVAAPVVTAADGPPSHAPAPAGYPRSWLQTELLPCHTLLEPPPRPVGLAGLEPSPSSGAVSVAGAPCVLVFGCALRPCPSSSRLGWSSSLAALPRAPDWSLLLPLPGPPVFLASSSPVQLLSPVPLCPSVQFYGHGPLAR